MLTGERASKKNKFAEDSDNRIKSKKREWM